MRRWLRDPPLPVFFALATVSWGIGVWGASRLPGMDRPLGTMAFAAPGFGTGMTIVLVVARRRDRYASGLDVRRHVQTQRAVYRGDLPADPTTWPCALQLIAVQRHRLGRYRWAPAVLAVLALVLALVLVAGRGRDDRLVDDRLPRAGRRPRAGLEPAGAAAAG